MLALLGASSSSKELVGRTTRHSIMPKHAALFAECEGLPTSVCIAELLDNGIRAGASRLSISVSADAHDRPAKLLYTDNGVRPAWQQGARRRSTRRTAP